MRQVVLQAPGEVKLRDAEIPEPARDEVRVRPHTVGICGSDLHALSGKHPWIDLPVVPGHEVAGTVDALGPSAGDLAIGDEVLLEANLVCGRCLYCAMGRYNLCEGLKVVGCQTSGGMADAFVAPADRFHRIPEGVTMAAAALIEPLSTVTHALRIVGGVGGAVVAVLGAGSIGLMCVRVARAMGAEAIAVTDPLASKRERSLSLGAESAFDPTRRGTVKEIRSSLPRRPDVVFDCVATQSSLEQAFGLALNGGTIGVIGVPTGTVEIPLPLLQDKEILVQGVAMYIGEDVQRATELIVSGEITASGFVTSSYPLDEAPMAFDAAKAGEQVKVQLTV